MTSVLHYRDPLSSRGFLSMTTPTFPPHMATIRKDPSYEGQSSGSESKKHQQPGAKRRPSRAGTRSVTTLTAAQLERKRANDREAQRAIRQRTKELIENLERQIAALRAQQDPNSSNKIVELMRRNEELENENAVLRSRLSHAVAALGVSDCNAANMIPATDTSGILSAGGNSSSPSDRVQMLSQPRRASTGTARSVTSVPDQATPVSQPGHWQPQHPAYAPSVSSPHMETPPSMNDIPNQSEAVRWSPHLSQHSQHPQHPQHPQHSQHHPVSMAVAEGALHAIDTSGMSYSYVVDSNSRAMSYPLENSQLVASQSMQQMTGYGTPTSNPSPHPQDYQRPMSVPVNPPQSAIHPPHPHTPQQTHSPYQAYANHQSFSPQVSHPGEMQMMTQAPHGQPQMMNDQGTMMYHMQSNMKMDQH